MDDPPDHIMQQHGRVVAEAGANGENIGNNSGIVNGELDGAGDKVGSSTNNLEEAPWSSYIVTTVWAEHLEEDSENIYWSNKHN